MTTLNDTPDPDPDPAELLRGLRDDAHDAQWESADDANRKPDKPETEYSTQSMSAIEKLREGMTEPTVTQIDGHGPDSFSVQVNGKRHLLPFKFSSEAEYMRFLRELVDDSDSVIKWQRIQEERMGVLDLDLPVYASDGRPATKIKARLDIILPPIAMEGAKFSLRKHTAATLEGVDFVASGMLSQQMWEFLQACVAAKVNMIFVGPMGSGKSTLLRALAHGFGDDEKIAVVEQVPELALQKPLAESFVYQPKLAGLTLSDVIEQQLYHGIDRLIVGETHLEGITRMLETMIVAEGSMSTYHAYSTEMAGERMKLALQSENGNLTAETAVSLIRQAVDIVIVLERHGGVRRVNQISEIDWRETSGSTKLAGRDLFRYNHSSGRFEPSMASRPDPNGRVMQKAAAKGVPMNDNWFVNPDLLHNA
jgi:pilus assembly protein CpaF